MTKKKAKANLKTSPPIKSVVLEWGTSIRILKIQKLYFNIANWNFNRNWIVKVVNDTLISLKKKQIKGRWYLDCFQASWLRIIITTKNRLLFLIKGIVSVVNLRLLMHYSAFISYLFRLLMHLELSSIQAVAFLVPQGQGIIIRLLIMHLYLLVLCLDS